MTEPECTKACSKCGVAQPLLNFNKSRQNKDGRCGWCKLCVAEYHKQYRKTNQKRIQAKQREWELANPDKVKASRNKPENKQRKRESDRRYYEANKQRAKQAMRGWYERNREDAIERASQWYWENQERRQEYLRNYRDENSERMLAIGRARRARKRNAEGSHTLEEWLALCEHYGYCCLCCGEAKPLTADHVVPLSKGGTDYIDNIQPLCKSCNSKKRTKTIDYR